MDSQARFGSFNRMGRERQEDEACNEFQGLTNMSLVSLYACVRVCELMCACVRVCVCVCQYSLGCNPNHFRLCNQPRVFVYQLVYFLKHCRGI